MNMKALKCKSSSLQRLAHNNYLLLGVVMQHVNRRAYGKCRKMGLNEKVCSLLPLTLTNVSPTSSRTEHLISLFGVGEMTVDVNTQ